MNEGVNENISISVDVKNNSNVGGEEVVQLYCRDLYSTVTRPVKELGRYERVFSKAGESISVDFDVEIKDLAFYDINMNYCVEKGEFEFMVGGSSENKHLISKKIQVNNRYEF